MTQKILIIDDEIDFCLLLKTFLEKRNHEVYTAHTLRDGLSCLEQNRITIVFLDNNLPDGYGWKHAKSILDDFGPLRLNLISAHQSSVPELKEYTSVNVLEKPISLLTIEEYIR